MTESAYYELLRDRRTFENAEDLLVAYWQETYGYTGARRILALYDEAWHTILPGSTENRALAKRAAAAEAAYVAECPDAGP